MDCLRNVETFIFHRIVSPPDTWTCYRADRFVCRVLGVSAFVRDSQITQPCIHRHVSREAQHFNGSDHTPQVHLGFLPLGFQSNLCNGASSPSLGLLAGQLGQRRRGARKATRFISSGKKHWPNHKMGVVFSHCSGTFLWLLVIDC